MKLWRFPLFAATAGLAALLPTPALAHPVNTQIEDFYAGVMHPSTAPSNICCPSWQKPSWPANAEAAPSVRILVSFVSVLLGG